jgi:hypothetical protein
LIKTFCAPFFAQEAEGNSTRQIPLQKREKGGKKKRYHQDERGRLAFPNPILRFFLIIVSDHRYEKTIQYQGYEMESPLLHNPDQAGQHQQGHQPLPTHVFLNEVTNIRSVIATFRQNVLQIEVLHNQTLQSYDNGATSGSSGQLEALVADTSVLTKELRDGIKALERDSLIMDDYAAQNTKRQHADKLKKDFEKE